MNFTYIRKSERPVEEIARAVREKKEFSLGGESRLEGGGLILFLTKSEWVEAVARHEPALLGMVPLTLFLIPGEKTSVAIGNARLLGGLSPLAEIRVVAEEMDKEFRSLVDEVSGAGEPVVKSVRLYSTETCPYCKMEKDFLDANKVAHEVLMVDRDHKAGEEMVMKTGQMGVPVTEVLYEDGESEFVIGFDKGRLKQLLQLK